MLLLLVLDMRVVRLPPPLLPLPRVSAKAQNQLAAATVSPASVAAATAVVVAASSARKKCKGTKSPAVAAATASTASAESEQLVQKAKTEHFAVNKTNITRFLFCCKWPAEVHASYIQKPLHTEFIKG
jgi:hypothetical protein